MNIEEVEEAKKYENLQTKPVLDPFKSTAPHRKVRELPRNMNIEEVEEPETMKIYRQNPRASARPPRKLRKFTDETNMQARNHENSDEICAQPVRHLDLATPAFYTYRKNPKCYHTVWGKTIFPNLKPDSFWGAQRKWGRPPGRTQRTPPEIVAGRVAICWSSFVMETFGKVNIYGIYKPPSLGSGVEVLQDVNEILSTYFCQFCWCL